VQMSALSSVLSLSCYDLALTILGSNNA
jgi:hypothetical protein